MPTTTGARFLAAALRGYGVSHVFLVPAILTPTLAEMEDLGIVRVTAHSELAAAYMADGYARAAHRPGVCLAQAVGAANLAAGLRDAHLARSPIVALTGGPHPDTRYRHLYQEVEDFPMFAPVTKLNARVDRPERLPDLLRQAFRAATTGAPGPVHLELAGRAGEGVQGEADLELVVEEEFGRYPPHRPEPDPERVAAATRLLAGAERPVLVAGGGVAASGAAAELVALAERLQVPVATSLNGKGCILDDHPLALGVVGTYGRWSANRAVAEADLVCFVGSRAGGLTTHNWRFPPPGCAVVQIDLDPAELGRNYPLRVGILADARAALRRLTEAAPPAPPRTAWLRHVRSLRDDWWAQVAPLAASDASPLRPERLCRELADFLPPDAVVVADTGHAAIWSGNFLELRHPGQRYIRCAGTLGWGFPASLGAKCALPDRPVFCFTGDGGFYYHLAELETAARLGIPVVVVVNDNHSLGQTRRGFDAAYGGTQRGRAREMWVFRETSLAAVAAALGCLGLRVERPGDLRDALQAALAAGRPALVDAVSELEATPPGPLG